MTPEQKRIAELEKQVKKLTTFMLSFDSVPTVSPQVAATIKIIAGNATLTGLTDVSLSSPSNGQVLEYLNGLWINATDNV